MCVCENRHFESSCCVLNPTYCNSSRAKQEVQLAKNIKLLDSPGIVMATSNSEVAMVLRNCIKVR